MGKKLTYEEVKYNLHNLGYELLSKEYLDNRQKLLLKDVEGYLYLAQYSNLAFGKCPDKVSKYNPYTIQNIKLWLKLNNKQFKLISDTYINNSKNLKWKCLNPECGDPFENNWGNISQGRGCPFCRKHRIANKRILKVNAKISRLKDIEEKKIKPKIRVEKTTKSKTKFIVYKAQSPSNRMYIGITSVPLKRRIYRHVYSAITQNKQYAFSRAIRKYGIDNIEWEIIDYAKDYNELLELEKYWIKKLNTVVPNGYNLTSGGEGTFGYHLTEDQQAK